MITKDFKYSGANLRAAAQKSQPSPFQFGMGSRWRPQQYAAGKFALWTNRLWGDLKHSFHEAVSQNRACSSILDLGNRAVSFSGRYDFPIREQRT
jgi:hypothetical protein